MRAWLCCLAPKEASLPAEYSVRFSGGVGRTSTASQVQAANSQKSITQEHQEVHPAAAIAACKMLRSLSDTMPSPRRTSSKTNLEPQVDQSPRGSYIQTTKSQSSLSRLPVTPPAAAPSPEHVDPTRE